MNRILSYPISSARALGSFAVLASLLLAVATPASAGALAKNYFKRIATFPVVTNFCAGSADPECVDTETVAEIVAASTDKMTLIYTDSETGNLGFVDISDPTAPVGDGLVDLGGEPTSVGVAGDFALVAVNTSESFVNPSGVLKVVKISKPRSIVREIPLGGQPDAVSVSPNLRHAAIAIENERDEDLCVGGTEDGKAIVDEEDLTDPVTETTEDGCEDGGGVVGGLPQAPAGFVVIVDIKTPNNPATWTTRTVSLTGLPGMKFPTDPEPEFVDINAINFAVVTMQENNHIAIINLRSGKVLRSFPAGSVDLTAIDTEEEGLITLNSSLDAVPREADAVVWTSQRSFVTADEGDLDGGSRGFTHYNLLGDVEYTSGNSVEHTTVRLGHYPEERSGNKGAEPEGVAYGRYGERDLLFVGSERASVILVYDLPNQNGRLFGSGGLFVAGRRSPELLQVLPVGVGPEGLLAIPGRDLFVASAEVDDRGDKIRSSLTIYELQSGDPTYPTVMSANRTSGPGTGLPIPWGALSGLAADTNGYVYTVHDSFYINSRIYKMDVSASPAVIVEEIPLKDDVDPLGLDDFNFDLEGIAIRDSGGFWLVSEGAGTVGDEDRPVTSLNELIEVGPDGEIMDIVVLPDAVNAKQLRFGFEGVASVGSGAAEYVYVAFQREWDGDPDNNVRLGIYKPEDGTWQFLYYPIEDPTSPAGGWVGLSDIVDLGSGRFAVIERDNQGGPDAAIKWVCTFDVDGLTMRPEAEAPNFDVVAKTCVDVMPAMLEAKGVTLEKIEGLTVAPNGDAWMVNDNDGVDDSNGETQLINLGDILR